MKNLKKLNKGFTMIELIIVIAVLGILAAVAVPKFINLVPAAQTATRSGVNASLNTALSLVHAQWVANGQTGNSVTMSDGSKVNVDVNGYPDIVGTYNTTAQCQALLGLILQNPSADIVSNTTYGTNDCIINDPSFGSGGKITLTDSSAS